MKTIFITGASSGIGKAVAKLFAANEWRVIATMRTPEKETELTHFNNVALFPLDVTNPTQVKQTIEKALGQYDVDVLFNNAGYGMKGPLEEVPEEEIYRLLDTDLLGCMRIMQAFIPHFKQKRNGLILTTTSIAGIVAFPIDSVYNAAKWGQEGLCEALYYELRPYHVQVKTLVPGAIRTNFVMKQFPYEAYKKPSERLGKLLIPDFETRFPGAEETAHVVWEAVTDGKDQMHYIAGDVAKEIYAKRQELGKDGFMHYLYETLFETEN
jgi:NAD(P)-dependent dehydrogenase (short-subunit alcohol dehydrogenase family)